MCFISQEKNINQGTPLTEGLTVVISMVLKLVVFLLIRWINFSSAPKEIKTPFFPLIEAYNHVLLFRGIVDIVDTKK